MLDKVQHVDHTSFEHTKQIFLELRRLTMRMHGPNSSPKRDLDESAATMIETSARQAKKCRVLNSMPTLDYVATVPMKMLFNSS